MQRKEMKKFFGAILEDAISMMGVPVSTSKFILSKAKPDWLDSTYLLKWDDLNFILLQYTKHRRDLLRFDHNGKKYVVPQIIVFDNTCQKIPYTKIIIRAKSIRFELDESLRAFSEEGFAFYKKRIIVLRKMYKNRKLMRLHDMRYYSKNGTLNLYTQPVMYEDSCRSNLCLDYRPKNRKYSLREKLHRGNRLETLRNSKLANHIGISCLLFTVDNLAILPMRSRKVPIFPNQLSPSFSGGMDFLDASQSNELKLVRFLREGFEELKLFPDDLMIDSFVFLALTRELIRGGKPELFFTAKTKLSKEIIYERNKDAISRDELKGRRWVFWDFGERSLEDRLSHEDKYDIKYKMDQLLIQHEMQLSTPLLTNLLLWMRSRINN